MSSGARVVALGRACASGLAQGRKERGTLRSYGFVVSELWLRILDTARALPTSATLCREPQIRVRVPWVSFNKFRNRECVFCVDG